MGYLQDRVMLEQLLRKYWQEFSLSFLVLSCMILYFLVSLISNSTQPLNAIPYYIKNVVSFSQL